MVENEEQIISEEMARFVGERRRTNLVVLKNEYRLAEILLKQKGDAVLWQAFRLTQKRLKKEVDGRVKFGLYVPRISLKEGDVFVRGKYVIPTLSLSWDIQSGLLGSQKEVSCCILQAGGEVTDLVFGNCGEHIARVEPGILSDLQEVSRMISGQIVGAEDHLRPDRKDWRFEIPLNSDLSTRGLFETAEDHQLHYIYI